jgi:hypothetical protein
MAARVGSELVPNRGPGRIVRQLRIPAGVERTLNAEAAILSRMRSLVTSLPELGKGQQHIERQAPHRACRIVLLRHRQERPTLCQNLGAFSRISCPTSPTSRLGVQTLSPGVGTTVAQGSAITMHLVSGFPPNRCRQITALSQPTSMITKPVWYLGSNLATKAPRGRMQQQN